MLEHNPQQAAGSSARPQRLLLPFPSQDITFTGYRLHLLCEQLDQQQALRLKAEDTRLANLHPESAFVVKASVSLPPHG